MKTENVHSGMHNPSFWLYSILPVVAVRLPLLIWLLQENVSA